MRNGLYALMFLCLLGSIGMADPISTMNLGMKAPWVEDKDSAPASTLKEAGDIVFDISEDLFYGYTGTQWVNLSAAASAVSGEVWVSRATGHGNNGGANTKIRTFGTTVRSTGSSISYNRSTTLGDTFTIQEAGVYSIYYADRSTSGAYAIGISLNASSLNTNIGALTSDGEILAFTEHDSSGYASVSVTTRLAQGDVIRAHTDGTPNAAASGANKFHIVKVSNL